MHCGSIAEDRRLADMITRMDSKEFWGHVPESQRVIRERANEIGMEMSYFIMGHEDDKNAPTVVALKMEPGAVTVRHAHASERIEIIVRGSLHVGDLVLRSGDVMKAGVNEMYGPHVAGPEGCLTFESFSNHSGISLTTYETDKGNVTLDMSTGVRRPDGVIRPR
jgi:anti-sigma factor ChrR (cupin superfamily)